MLDIALKLLKELTDAGFKAYLVGGFVRDYLLGIESQDIDVTTNATPKEIKEIFNDSFLPTEDYGSVIVMKRNIRFEITTFRRELTYAFHRKPVEIQYIDDLYEDLLRRDFTINTICMDEEGQIIDFLAGQDDLKMRKIRTVGDAKERFEQDSLRILRAVRFATSLNFELDDDIVLAIDEKKDLLKELSYQRKREELDKIFVSGQVKKGIELLLKLNLDKVLELKNLSKVTNTDSLIGIWSVLDVVDVYPFTNNEKQLIEDIQQALLLTNTDPMALYEYGLYVNSVAGDLKGIDRKIITEAYANLVIQSRKDLAVTSEDIMNILGREPGEYLKDIYEDIEREVLYRRLSNLKSSILPYITSKY